MPKITH